MTIANPLNSDGDFISVVISKPILSRDRGSLILGDLLNPGGNTLSHNTICMRYHILLETCSTFRKQTGFLRQEITVVYGGRSIPLSITSTDVTYLVFN